MLRIPYSAYTAFWLMEKKILMLLINNIFSLERYDVLFPYLLLWPLWENAVDQHLLFAYVLLYLASGSDSHICKKFIQPYVHNASSIKKTDS